VTAVGTTLASPRRPALREFGAGVVTIMVKELRSRMRGRRAFVVLTVYLGLLALITYGVYLVVAPNVRDAGFGNLGGQANASAIIGQSIFSVLSIFQLILVCFIAPAFTAGQISLEREKQTLDLLVSTPLRPGAIVIGKLAAALAFVVLMIVAAIPITAIVLMYGGASVGDIVRQQVVLLSTALVLGAVGLFFSAWLKRTQAATVLTYIVMLALTLGTGMLFVFWTILAIQGDDGFVQDTSQRAPEQLLYLNPGIAMLDVVANTEPGGTGGLGGMLAQLRGEPGFVDGGVECVGDVCRPVDQFGNPIADEAGAATGYWVSRVAITFVLVSAVLTVLSMRLVVPAGMRWAFRRRRSLISAGGAPPPADVDGAPAIEEVET
jgi:ABC-type transport system involved in multi-copper enzyme maturation permease subunit